MIGASNAIVVTSMEELRCMYELPSLAHFINSKKEQFKFMDIDIRGFEVSICDSDSKLFDDIVCRLLRRIKKDKSIRVETCESHLRSYAAESSSEFSQLVKADFKSIVPPDKLRILKYLADQTKEKKNELDEMLNEEFGADGQDATIINVGLDSENRIYWYFDDLRLYRQRNGQPKTNCDWQCVATTCEAWEELIQRFSQSADEQELDLHSYLSTALYPVLKPLLETQPKDIQTYTNEEIISAEAREMDGSAPPGGGGSDKKPATPVVDPSELIKSENPELSKVLSEEPSTSIVRSTSSQLNGGDSKKSTGGVSFTQHQQSQLFVFPTKLANMASEAVGAGSHSSIYKYHLDDLHTKNFLQGNPSMHVTVPSQSRLPMPPQRATNPFRHSRASASSNHHAPLQWNGVTPPPSGVPSGAYGQSMMPRQPPMAGSPCPPNMPGYMNNGMRSPMPAHPMHQHDISHMIVPNENLTPGQLQRRETGLANLRKIHQMLLADEGDPQSQPTDFSHINMAQDRQCGQPSYNNFSGYGMNAHMGSPHGPSMYGPGNPMSPMGNPAMMESKPPPPYPMPSAGPVPQPAPKKSGRKRKGSTVQSPTPASPKDQPPVKAEKQSIPPSPLAAQSTNAHSLMPGGLPGALAGMPLPDDGSHGMPGPMRGMTQQQALSRQHSLPNFPPGRGGGPGSAPSRMLQAGQPIPYQNVGFGGQGDAPPSYGSLRRGMSMESMSMESMTAPPSQRQQYLQPENQERVIERQLNMPHQSPAPSQLFADQQAMYSSGLAVSSSSAAALQASSSFSSTAADSNSTLTNITSSSLANLAKGVEQMSQKMSQGGPYGDMQGTNNNQDKSEQPGSLPTSSTNPQQQPSVNNTFVNTHMSIGHVNIQNVTANQTYQGPAGMHPHMQQNVDVSMNNFGGGMPQPEPMYKPPQPAAATPAVSIQNKGRNTIQYLPVSQPSIAPSHESVIPAKPSFDFMSVERYASPTPSVFMHGDTPGHVPAGAPHSRHPHPMSMYGGSGVPMLHPSQPGGGTPGVHMVPNGAPQNMLMSEGFARPHQPQYMMSAQQSSLNMGYNPAPAPPGHPGMMDSQVHMRSQHLMMSGAYPGGAHPGMPPGSYGAPAGYAPSSGAPPSGMMYGGAPPGTEYMQLPSGHPMASRGPAMSQSMMMSQLGGPYMGNPAGPPYM